MQYKDALKVKEGELLCLKYSNYKITQVLAIEHNRRYHMITFHCTDGEYAHKEVILPISNEELAQKYIKDPTREYTSSEIMSWKNGCTVLLWKNPMNFVWPLLRHMRKQSNILLKIS